MSGRNQAVLFKSFRHSGFLTAGGTQPNHDGNRSAVALRMTVVGKDLDPLNPHHSDRFGNPDCT